MWRDFMFFLSKNFFLQNSYYNWMILLFILLFILISFVLVKRFGINKLKKYAKSTTNKFDDLFIEMLEKTHWVFLLALSLFVATGHLEITADFNKIRSKIIIVLLLIQLAYWVNISIKFWLNNENSNINKNGQHLTTVRAIAFLSRILVWIITILLVLDNLGFEIKTLLAGLGVGGIAVALAVQNVLGDLLASLSIILDQPFVIGDFIQVDSFLGTVEHIGIKTTRLRSITGEQIIFSNNDLLKSKIRNYKRMFERRILMNLMVSYNNDVEMQKQILNILNNILQKIDKIRVDRVHLKELGSYSIIYEIVYFVLDVDYNLYMNIQQTINMEILEAFKKENISLAYLLPMTALPKGNI